MTTVNQPAIEMANQAAELLLSQINKTGKEDTSVHRLKPNLLSRKSC
ncbi:substrate-binding domain-containing protein [Peribacillus butanolivorans]